MEQNSPTPFTAQHEEAFNNLTSYSIQLRPDHIRSTEWGTVPHIQQLRVLYSHTITTWASWPVL